MSMECVRKIVRPVMGDLQFNLERGTRVRVHSSIDGLLEGLVAQNPRDANPKFLELVQVHFVVGKRSAEEYVYFGFMRIDGSEVISVEIMDAVKPEVSLVTESLHHTIVIKTGSSFSNFIPMLKDVNEVALNLYGIFIGRAGKVAWITLFFQDTLIAIDALALAPKVKSFWKTLQIQLFENERICKVMYNSRPIIDYLFHKHCAMILNVDDLQVSELVVRGLGHSPVSLGKYKQSVKYLTLSSMLETILKDKQIPAEEIKLLTDFHKQDFSTNSPLMERPMTEKKYYKCIAVDMKYLLEIKKVLDFKYLTLKRTSVNLQLLQLVEGRNDKMEFQLRFPERVPKAVIENAIPQLEDKPVANPRNVQFQNGTDEASGHEVIYYSPKTNR